jgi:hypothetical protein
LVISPLDLATSAWQFERFRDAIAKLPAGLTEDEAVSADLRVFEDEKIALYYSPFDYVNERARVILMGITPGKHQHWKACSVARDALTQGLSDMEALRRAKQSGSFSGPMRKNLVTMLDGIGLNLALGLGSTSWLFEDAGAHALFSTSAVSFTVLVRGRNYTGSTPRLLGHPVLRRVVEEVFAHGVSRVPAALIIPLGKVATEVADHLVALDKIEGRRILRDFPHPSGGNGHRVREYNESRRALTRGVEEWFAR